MLSDSRTPAPSPSPMPSDKSNLFLDLPPPVQADMLSSTYQLSPSTQLHPTPAPVVRPRIPLPQVRKQVIPVSTAPPTGPQPMLQPTATPAIPAPLANSTAQLQGPVPMVPRSVRLQPAPVSSAAHQPAYSYSRPAMEPLISTHHGQQTAPVFYAPSPGYAPLPGAELLLATALGIPRPPLPVFESGRESDFALLKLAPDNVLGSNVHLSKQYKYQVLIGHIKLPSALQLAKVYMHDPAPYTSVLQALQDKYGQPRQLERARCHT